MGSTCTKMGPIERLAWQERKRKGGRKEVLNLFSVLTSEHVNSGLQVQLVYSILVGPLSLWPLMGPNL